MATRFWLSGTAFTTINPGTLGTWGSDSLKTIKYLWGTAPPDDDSFGTVAVSMNGAFTSVHRQYISASMDAGIVFNSSTTWTMVNQMSESSSLANAFQRFHVAIVSQDGTTVRAEFSSGGEKDGTELGTSLASRVNVNTGGIVYTTVAGDRIVLELGVDKDATGTHTITYRYGNTGTNDLSSTEGDTDSTDNPWFECSANITFGTPEPPPPTFNEDYEVTTYIGAVLDDYL